MNFIILVSGSYFFEWSDTVLKVQMNANQLFARITRNDDDVYKINNASTDDNMNIHADGNQRQFQINRE